MKLSIKILIIALIAATIAVIWLAKNLEREESKEGNNQDLVLESEEFDFESLKSYGQPIVIDFASSTCAKCKNIKPALKNLNKKYRGEVLIKYYDVNKDEKIFKDFPVNYIPTQFFFDEKGNPFVPEDPKGMGLEIYKDKESGKHIYTRHVGGMTKQEIEEIIDEMRNKNE